MFVIDSEYYLKVKLTSLKNKKYSREVSMMKAIGWGCWYHLGSMAFGSFVIAVVEMIRIVFEYIVK